MVIQPAMVDGHLTIGIGSIVQSTHWAHLIEYASVKDNETNNIRIIKLETKFENSADITIIQFTTYYDLFWVLSKTTLWYNNCANILNIIREI